MNKLSVAKSLEGRVGARLRAVEARVFALES
jgi:hypothetical protein